MAASLLGLLFAACLPTQQTTLMPSASVAESTVTQPAQPQIEPTHKAKPTLELPPKIRDLTPISPIIGDLEKMTPISPQDIPPHLKDIADQAISVLAEYLQIENAEIAILSIKAVTWSDSSLGCSQPGINYLQVLTPGYHVLLSAHDQYYSYNANKTGYGLICENPNLPYSEGVTE